MHGRDTQALGDLDASTPSELKSSLTRGAGARDGCPSHNGGASELHWPYNATLCAARPYLRGCTCKHRSRPPHIRCTLVTPLAHRWSQHTSLPARPQLPGNSFHTASHGNLGRDQCRAPGARRIHSPHGTVADPCAAVTHVANHFFFGHGDCWCQEVTARALRHGRRLPDDASHSGCTHLVVASTRKRRMWNTREGTHHRSAHSSMRQH